eukprot:8073644-Alexandrium_andersonii.AAC.1
MNCAIGDCEPHQQGDRVEPSSHLELSTPALRNARADDLGPRVPTFIAPTQKSLQAFGPGT